jgi:Cdc6-like AAA superfamily ATPase
VSSQASEFQLRRFRAGDVFTPGAPITEADLFAGRSKQINMIINAISQRGFHAIIFGERGVGKTSISNVLDSFTSRSNNKLLFPRVNCTKEDTFSTIWRRLFHEVIVTEKRLGVGFAAKDEDVSKRVVETLPRRLGPDDIRRVLTDLAEGVILVPIFDEFDRIHDQATKIAMADTIKMLSDYSVKATVLMIGVADSIEQLIAGHQSIERSLIQIPMPRMSPDEIMDIVRRGTKRLSMTVENAALDEIRKFSQGLPYVTHLLALHSTRAALDDRSLELRHADVDKGIEQALEEWHHSTRATYYAASKSPQPGHMYKEVLLACALAKTDDFGFFTAADVREPLRVVTGRKYDIPNFAKHLKELAEGKRGTILLKTGQVRKLRYRFNGPLLRPYIVMRAFADSLAPAEALQTLLV